MEAVDEQQLEHEVHDVAGDDDDERQAQVRDAAQVALAGQRHEHERQADRRDPQIGHREVAGLAAAAHRRHDRHGGRRGDGQQRESDRQRQPERLSRYLVGVAAPPGAVEAGDLRGGGVAQEVEDTEERRENGAGEPERCELVHAEMADDRRVGEHVERLGRQRAERRQGDREDLAIVRRAAKDPEGGGSAVVDERGDFEELDRRRDPVQHRHPLPQLVGEELRAASSDSQR